MAYVKFCTPLFLLLLFASVIQMTEGQRRSRKRRPVFHPSPSGHARMVESSVELDDLHNDTAINNSLTTTTPKPTPPPCLKPYITGGLPLVTRKKLHVIWNNETLSDDCVKKEEAAIELIRGLRKAQRDVAFVYGFVEILRLRNTNESELLAANAKLIQVLYGEKKYKEFLWANKEAKARAAKLAAQTRKIASQVQQALIAELETLKIFDENGTVSRNVSGIALSDENLNNFGPNLLARELNSEKNIAKATPRGPKLCRIPPFRASLSPDNRLKLDAIWSDYYRGPKNAPCIKERLETQQFIYKMSAAEALYLNFEGYRNPLGFNG